MTDESDEAEPGGDCASDCSSASSDGPAPLDTQQIRTPIDLPRAILLHLAANAPQGEVIDEG